jgi:hypothetical protein
MPHFNHCIVVCIYSFIFLIRAHIVEMAAAEVNDLGQRGGRESEQVAAAQVSVITFTSRHAKALPERAAAIGGRC